MYKATYYFWEMLDHVKDKEKVEVEKYNKYLRVFCSLFFCSVNVVSTP